MTKAFGIITSSAEQKVEGLQNYRSIGAFSFLGRYRVIDFPISNFSNSDIDRIQVYISSNPRSIVSTIGTGRHYNINSKKGRIQLLFPTENNLNEIYNTNISAFVENLEKIEGMHQEYVVITPSCMVFRQDFDAFLKEHQASGTDISVLYHTVDDAREGYSTCNKLILDGERVASIAPCLGDNDVANVFMETYVMKKDLLLSLIRAARATSSMYSLSDIVNARAAELKIRAVEHKGYFAPITSLKSYHKANERLLDKTVADELFTDEWPIYTRTSDSCPTQIFPGASVKHSVVSNGCTIKGSVEGSIIGRGVSIGEGAVIKNSVVLAYTKVGAGAVLENQVVDKYATIQDGVKVIAGSDNPGYIRKRDTI